MKGKRFDITETEGGVKGLYVIVDKETGVNYLMAKFGITGDYARYLIRTVSRLSAGSKTIPLRNKAIKEYRKKKEQQTSNDNGDFSSRFYFRGCIYKQGVFFRPDSR